MTRLSWLHLSDLLMGTKGARWLGGDYRKEFERDLRALHKQTGPWDLVFITGDLTQTGSEREFQALDAALEALWGYLDSLGSQPTLLAVPGNHDLSRPALGHTLNSLGLIEASYWDQSPRVRELFWNEPQSLPRQSVQHAFQAFTAWLDQWQTRHQSGLEVQVRKGSLAGDFAATVEKDGLRLGIAGLNSAFLLPNADDASTTRFTLDELQLDAATGGSSAWALLHHATLLLTHHSPAQLHESGLKQILANLAKAEGGVLHLCGSHHQFAPSVSNAAMLKSLRLFQAPSLSGQGENFGMPIVAGYVAGQLEVSHQGEGFRLFPRVVTPVAPDREAFGPFKAVDLDPEGALNLRIALSDRMRSIISKGPSRAPAPRGIQPPRPKTPAGIQLRATLDTGKVEVTGLAWVPSGKELVAGLADGALLCWEPGTQGSRWVIQAHQSPVQEVCLSPDGKKIATRSTDSLEIWKAVSGKRLHRLNLSGAEGFCLAWSSQGVLAASSNSGVVHLWDETNWPLTIPLEYLPSSPVVCLAWNHEGDILACGGQEEGIRLFSVKAEEDFRARSSNRLPRILSLPAAPLDIDWRPLSSEIAVALDDGTIHIIDAARAPLRGRILQGHTAPVANVSFSPDARLLVSQSLFGTLLFHSTETWELVATLEEPSTKPSTIGTALSFKANALATSGPDGSNVRIWDIDTSALLGRPTPTKTLHSVSAKVVLVGEGRAGKSSLAQRLVEDRHEEQDPTHAMRTWTLPLEKLAPESQLPANQRRELVLWDMGGQSEYRLVHQLFLRDTSVALMVMETARGKAALDEMAGWDERLSAQAGSSQPLRKLLIGSKVDHERVPVDRPAIEQFLSQRHFDPDAYLSTSAKTGEGISKLKAWLASAIDWSTLGSTSQPELFEKLRQHILQLRERGRVVITLRELERELSASSPEVADPEALRAVVEQLGRQGLIMDTRMADGTQALVLEIEQVERYANSLIVAARDNPNRVPAVDVAAFSRAATLPRIAPQERLPRDQEVIVLDCVVELLLQHGLCLEHGGLLVFPSLFLPTHSETGASFRPAVSLSYEFAGPIDNIYASLITAIAMSRGFGPMRLWQARAEFGQPGHDSVGLHKVQLPEQQARGFARLELYFDAGTPKEKRDLFVSFVDTHLREQPGVEIQEQLSVTCTCNFVFPASTVQRRLANKQTEITCPECDTHTPLTASASEARNQDPELHKKIRVLRTDMSAQRTQSVTETRMSMQEAQTTVPQSTPIRILHLSDLHVGAGADPMTLLQPLMADLKDPADLKVDRLDYLVISGDITNRASPEEFQKALEFLSALRDRFGLTSERCIIVPGNHDLDWKTKVYEWQSQLDVDVTKLPPGSYRQQGEGYLVRDNTRYSERFQNFSKHFHHPLLQKEYPLDAEQQCIPVLSAETRLQFLAMNSSWEVDQWFKDRSHIHDGALARGLMAAKQQEEKAREAGLLPAGDELLRLAVWHHPITGNEKIQRDAFMTRLQQMKVRLVLHGHVHEERAELIGYTDPSTQVHVIGAGSFGAPTHHRPESVPRLYNLLEVARDHSQVRVHTRALRREGGAWEGHALWRDTQRGVRRTYYDVKLR